MATDFITPSKGSKRSTTLSLQGYESNPSPGTNGKSAATEEDKGTGARGIRYIRAGQAAPSKDNCTGDVPRSI